MQAYTETAPVNKPAVQFTLTPYEPPERIRLTDRVTSALAAIKPWVRDLPDRLARTWHRNPNHESGAHSKERGDRERQCARDQERLRQTAHFGQCVGHSPRLRASYFAVIGEVHRLMEAGDWWKPRPSVDRATGEVKARIYLPEDTWSAQTALAWCVAFLVRLLAALPRTTERATPRYNPRRAARSSEGRKEASRDWNAAAAFAGLAEKLARGQPDLPATG